MKVRFITLLVLSLLVMSVFSTASAEKVTLTFAGYHDYEDSGYDQIVALFEEEYPNIEVKPVWNPDRYEDRMRTMIAGGNAPDIIEVNDNYVKAYAANGYLISLDKLREASGVNTDDYVKIAFDFPVYKGQQYAWVLGTYVRTLYVNVDLFKENGVELPPTDKWDVEGWTWDDMIETAKKLTKDTDGDGRIDQWGISMAHDTGAYETVTRNNGGPGIYSEDGTQFMLAEPVGAEAIQKLADLTLVHNVQPPASTLRTFPATDMFVQGKLAMIFTGSTSLTQFRRDIKDFEWLAAPLPKIEYRYQEGSILTLGIPPNSKHPKEAFEFLKFVNSAKAQKVFADIGYAMPVKKDAQDIFVHPELKPANQDLLLDAMNYQVAINWTEHTERARSIYRPAIDLVMNGEESAIDAFNEVEKEIEDILSGKRR